MTTESAADFSLNPGFVSAVAQELRIPSEIIESLPGGSDWLFVVKIHAMIEASLNHMLLHALANGDKRLAEIISKLDTGDRSRGKLAFIKALDLLPKPSRQFITILSELRNNLVHDITQFDFTLDEWLLQMASDKRKTFRDSLTFQTPWFKDDTITKEFRSVMAAQTPRLTILFQSLEIIGRAADYSLAKIQELLEREAKRLEGLVETYEAGKRQEDTPSEG